MHILKSPSVGDMMFGVVYENQVVLFRMKAEEVSPQGPRRLKLAEEWARAYSELATSFTGPDVTSGTVAKRAGRYVCVLFSQSEAPLSKLFTEEDLSQDHDAAEDDHLQNW